MFSDIAKKVNAFKVSHPKTDLIRTGIGDVTRPLPQASIEAMHKAVDELASKETFHGYGPEQGYDFLIDAVIRNDYTRAASIWNPAKSLSVTAPRAIREISETSFATTTASA